MLLLIDNYDSFTYNLVHYFQKLGQEVEVYRNDAISIDAIHCLAPAYIVISPGPCTPNEAGLSLSIIEKFAGQIPILGVCLGHQAIAQCFGGKIIRASQPMHGKTSLIYHQNQGMFTGLPQGFAATRYHSLVADKNTLPKCFQITAWTQTKEDIEIMAIKHSQLPIEGVQFHPESILTENGHDLLKNFLRNYA